MRYLHVACCVAILGVGTAGAALAQPRPAPGGARVPTDRMATAPRCIPGFTLVQSGRNYTCTSAAIKCERPYQSAGDAGVKGDRFVYTCTRLE